MHTRQDFQGFFSVKPSGDNISPPKRLRTFISEYPDEDLTANLYRLEEEYKYYRAIHGDGNCFYRAIMFLYLREADLANFQKLFPYADLFTCKNLPFSNLKQFQSQQILRYVWERFLLPLSNLKPQQRQKQLERLFNTYANFDSILVAYFRALNYSYLLKHRAEFETFSYGGFDLDLQRIITFGKESQGLQLLSLAQILEAQITVLMVHREAYQKHIYNEEFRKNRNYIVSYRPGHYDIPTNEEQSNNTRGSQRSSFYDYFGETNDTYNGYDCQTPGNPTSNHKKSDLRPVHKQKTSEPAQVIKIKRPSEFSQLRVSSTSANTHRDSVELDKKRPVSLSSFKDSINSQTRDSNSKPGSRISSFAGQAQKSAQSQNNVTKIRSSWVQNQNKEIKKRIIFQSSLCLGFIVLFIAAAFALRS